MSEHRSESRAEEDPSRREPEPIEAPDLDVEAVMQEIRARLRERRAQAKSQGLDFEAYADGLYPRPPGTLLSREVHEAARYLGLEYDKVSVEMALTETRVPLAGRWVQRVRSALHGLVLFYVNRLAARQVRVNEQAARGLIWLVRDLEREIGELRGRVAELEAERGAAPGAAGRPGEEARSTWAPPPAGADTGARP